MESTWYWLSCRKDKRKGKRKERVFGETEVETVQYVINLAYWGLGNY